jgi:hypothetical protein
MHSKAMLSDIDFSRLFGVIAAFFHTPALMAAIIVTKSPIRFVS